MRVATAPDHTATWTARASNDGTGADDRSAAPEQSVIFRHLRASALSGQVPSTARQVPAPSRIHPRHLPPLRRPRNTAPTPPPPAHDRGGLCGLQHLRRLTREQVCEIGVRRGARHRSVDALPTRTQTAFVGLVPRRQSASAHVYQPGTWSSSHVHVHSNPAAFT